MAIHGFIAGRVGAAVAGAVVAIVAGVVSVEGGLVNHPNDPGKETNYGITQEVAKSHGWEGSMSELPINFVVDVYFNDYIRKPGYLPMVQIQPAVAEEVVDTAVNTGVSRSSRWFQTSLNALNRGGRDYPTIAVDGVVGPNTIKAYQSLEAVRGKVVACELVIKLMDAQQANHYLSLTHLNDFTVGWISHRIGNVPLTRCSDHSRYQYVFENTQ